MLTLRNKKVSKDIAKIIQSENGINNWEEIFRLSDDIKSKEVQPKQVIPAIASYFNPDKAVESMQAISLLEVLMKNCGSSFHIEVSTSSFQETLINFIEKNPNEIINDKLFELIQNWAFAFREKPKCINMLKTYEYFKNKGISFPPVVESEAMFSVDCAPEWEDGDECIRCKTKFNTIRRKHHCRSCGQIFCDDCSRYRTTLPKFGITNKEVRVCEPCFKSQNVNIDRQERYTPPEPPKVIIDENKAIEQREEELLQLALAISASEAEAAKNTPTPTKQEVQVKTHPKMVQEKEELPEDMDPELKRYLNRDLWEEKSSKLMPTAPPDYKPEVVNEVVPSVALEQKENKARVDYSFNDKQDLIDAINTTVNSFNSRLRSNISRGKLIEKDSTIQTSFNLLCTLRSQLSAYKLDLENRRTKFENLQDKVNEIHDAREAIEVLRTQNQIKINQEQELLAEMRKLKMQETMNYLRNEKRKMIQSQVNQQMVEPQPMMQQPMPYIPQQYNPNYGPYPTADLQPPGYYPPMPYNMHPHYALPGYQNQPSHVFPVSQLNQFPYNEMQGVMPANVPEPVGTNNPPVNVKNPPAQNEFENPTTTETTTEKIGNQPSQIEHPAPLVSPPTYDLAALENLPNVPKNDIEVKEKEPASQDAEGLLISFE